ncbi:hypothetical protein AYJ54_01160 [Bradyrhizobium centrolobii]|uniref:Uncharacterized protein n=1 Tax=Bradyrhizobium centrolobii TaxID=1505087 RepID=A0A176YFX8_9BRAD|nr:DUF6338 family protein [Bradyrhizobium centrolobii]OAF05543.1 hypothetical protein AYJ54_01160 [Bradyrhizobium centrolobii]
MPDLKSVESVYLVLAFVVPGMIITFVRAQFFTGRMHSLSESIVTYLAVTVLYYRVRCALLSDVSEPR